MARLNISDLGDLEVVTAAKSKHQDRHVVALEEIVDALREENRLLKTKLLAKPSTITQEMYDDICTRFQMECTKNIPF